MAADPPDRWLVVTVTSPSAEQRACAAEGLIACGATAVEELDGAVRTYLRPPSNGDAHATVRAVRRSLDAHGVAAPELTWEWQPAEDWLAAWRRGLQPRAVGDRLVVAPSWSPPMRVPGVETIVIDPQMAFGTGEHASTRGVLRLLQQRIRPRDDVLDVGTGSAILAIAAVRLGAARAHGVESDADALINARENVVRNDVAERVTLEQAVVDAAFLEARAGAHDLILANVLSGVLRPLLPAFRRALRPGGVLVLGGILESEAAALTAAAATARLALEAEDREDEWWSAAFTRTTS